MTSNSEFPNLKRWSRFQIFRVYYSPKCQGRAGAFSFFLGSAPGAETRLFVGWREVDGRLGAGGEAVPCGKCFVMLGARRSRRVLGAALALALLLLPGGVEGGKDNGLSGELAAYERTGYSSRPSTRYPRIVDSLALRRDSTRSVSAF